MVLLEAVTLPTAEGTELPAEHALADVTVVAARSVEALLAAVVDAGDPERGGIERQHGEGEARPDRVGAETRLVGAFPNLIVVVVEGDDLVAEPRVRVLVDEHGVAEQREVLLGLSAALDHPLELVRDVVDAERRVEAGRLEGPVRVVAAAGDLTDERKAVLADRHRELVHRGG